jgi:hypothetical protein
MTEPTEPPPEPAESRAIELLRLVGTRTPSIGPRFTTQVVARARVQRAFASPLRALGGLLMAFGAALTAAVRTGAQRRP